MTLEQKIRMAMAYSGINSQRVLADAVGISPQNFSKKMRRGSFTDAELEKMASAMGCRYYSGFIFGEAPYTVDIPPLESLKNEDDIAEKALRMRAEMELLEEQDEERAKQDDPDRVKFLEEKFGTSHETEEYKAQSAAAKAAWEAKVQERVKKLKK
jgi:hypothetical protein